MNTPNRLVKVGYMGACFGAALGTTSMGLLLALAGSVRGKLYKESLRDFPHPIYWLFVALLAIMAVSALLSPAKWLAALLTLGYGLVVAGFIFGTQWLRYDRDFIMKRLIPSLMLGSIAGYLYAIIKFFVLQPGRTSGLFVECNGLGTLIILCTGVSVGYLGTMKSEWRRPVIVIYLILAITALLLTFARGAWAGFFVMVLVLGIMNRNARRWTIPSLLSLLAVLATSRIFQARFFSAFSRAAYEDRFEIWLTTLRVIKDHPLFGVGAGVYAHVYRHYALPSATLKAAAFAHNIFLQVSAEFGIVGLLVFAAIIAQVLIMAWRLARSGNFFYQGVFAALSGVLVHQQVDIPIWGLEIGGAFWLLVGMIISLYLNEQLPSQASGEVGTVAVKAMRPGMGQASDKTYP